MSHSYSRSTTARKRLVFAILAGLVMGLVAILLDMKMYAPLAVYDTAALLYVSSVLVDVLRLNAAQTKEHALSENPGRTSADAILLIASIASLAAVGILVFRASNESGSVRTIDTIFGLLSVVISWSVVHTLFMLKYARLYYGEPEGGIDFGESAKPRYVEFAYLAFTVGMTFQVSDTQIQTKNIRTMVLKQALLAYLFGTVIIASTINVIVGLSS